MPLALSVVSMEVFAPHKMAETRPRHSNEGVPDPRIVTTSHATGLEKMWPAGPLTLKFNMGTFKPYEHMAGGFLIYMDHGHCLNLTGRHWGVRI